jgi:hypothetical protein
MPKRIHSPSDEIIRGPLRLVRPSWELLELLPPPERMVEDEIVRLLQTAARINERERLKALRRPPAE